MCVCVCVYPFVLTLVTTSGIGNHCFLTVFCSMPNLLADVTTDIGIQGSHAKNITLKLSGVYADIFYHLFDRWCPNVPNAFGTKFG